MQVRIGSSNNDASANTICAEVPSAAEQLRQFVPVNVSSSHAYLDLNCSAEGRYLHLLQPNPKCMEILEVEVAGRRHGCTKCNEGTYEDQTGSTSCKSCPWAWEASVPWGLVSDEESDDRENCKCNKGQTGSAGGFYQDMDTHRPTWRGVAGSYSVHFNNANQQFLHAALITAGSTDNIYNRPHDVNLHSPRAFNLQSNGGLTIVATVKFMGTMNSGEKIVDFGNDKNQPADNIILGRHGATDRIVAVLAEGSAAACQIVSGDGVIMQDEWMTITVQYVASANEISLRKNGKITAGPQSCMQTPSDRNVTRMFIGKSNDESVSFFHGEIMGLYIADKVLSNLSRSNLRVAQSSTWTQDVGSQYFRDQNIRAVERLNASASQAVDASLGSCSQTWRENSPWWRVDLQVPQLVVSVRVYNRFDCCQAELEGFDIRVGNHPTWEKNTVCASNVAAPTDPRFADVVCQAEGRYVFIVLPGINRTLALCEVEVVGLDNSDSSAISGLLPNCTSCIAGLGIVV